MTESTSTHHFFFTRSVPVQPKHCCVSWFCTVNW